jgi:NTE family protein
MTRTALVLGAGGLPGEAFEAGVLAALEEALGWDARSADVIIGTSAGSRVGTLLRANISAQDLFAYETNGPVSADGEPLLAKIREIPELPDLSAPRLPRVPPLALLTRAARNPWRSRAGLLTAALPTGTYPTAPFAEVLRRLTGTAWPEEALWIVAARLPFGERVVFGRGDWPECDVPQAVSASCCIPGIFAPVEIDDGRYVDGGVHSPTNADLLVDEDVDTVVVVSPMSTNREAVVWSRPNPFRMYFRALLAAEVRRLRKRGKTVLVFQPGAAEQRAMGMNAFAHWRTARIAELARRCVLDRMGAKRVPEAMERLAA